MGNSSPPSATEVGKAVKGGQEAVKVLKMLKIGNLAD